jgi:hypothetical protein
MEVVLLKKLSKMNSLSQYHHNTEYVGQIDKVREDLMAIYINVIDPDDKHIFDKMEDLLDQTRSKLVKENSDIADKYFKTRP